MENLLTNSNKKSLQAFFKNELKDDLIVCDHLKNCTRIQKTSNIFKFQQIDSIYAFNGIFISLELNRFLKIIKISMNKRKEIQQN